jgi:hypothetical protein
MGLYAWGVDKRNTLAANSFAHCFDEAEDVEMELLWFHAQMAKAFVIPFSTALIVAASGFLQKPQMASSLVHA